MNIVPSDIFSGNVLPGAILSSDILSCEILSSDTLSKNNLSREILPVTFFPRYTLYRLPCGELVGSPPRFRPLRFTLLGSGGVKVADYLTLPGNGWYHTPG